MQVIEPQSRELTATRLHIVAWFGDPTLNR
jgi:hypothetical protein